MGFISSYTHPSSISVLIKKYILLTLTIQKVQDFTYELSVHILSVGRPEYIRTLHFLQPRTLLYLLYIGSQNDVRLQNVQN
jgi:hypothetical protein